MIVTTTLKADWPDPKANHVLPYETAGLTLGPMLGAPTAESMRIWLRTAEPCDVELLYGTSIPFDEESKTLRTTTTSEGDQLGLFELKNLDADTTYYYGVQIAGELADIRPELNDPWPSFRTLPNAASCVDALHNPRGVFNVGFAIGHCASQEPGGKSGGQYTSTPAYNMIRQLHRDQTMFCFVNGDVIYEEQRDGAMSGLRNNYKLYFQRGRSFAALFRYTPALFTFDDHDVGWDIHGCGEVGYTTDSSALIRDPGLAAYQEYLAWANYRCPQNGQVRFGTAEFKAGLDTLFDPKADFTKLDPAQVSTIHIGPYTYHQSEYRKRPASHPAPKNAGVYGLVEVLDRNRLKITPAPKKSETAEYSIGTHHYFDWKISNCHFFALDTRGERSRPGSADPYDPKHFILGKAQKQWLIEGVQESDAEFIFIVSPDPWMIYHTGAHVSDKPEAKEDKGDGYPGFVHEREELLTLFDQIRKPILIFTGDVHHATSVKITDNVWEMMCGPLGSTGHPLNTLGNPPLGGDWVSRGRKVQVRWCAGFPNNLPFQRTRNTYYGIVQVNNVTPVGKPDGPVISTSLMLLQPLRSVGTTATPASLFMPKRSVHWMPRSSFSEWYFQSPTFCIFPLSSEFSRLRKNLLERTMKTILFLVLLVASSPLLAEENRGKLLFQDEFDRNESQETKDEVGNGWGTNSKSRAKGNKQVDLRDGAMYIYIHSEADHAVSVTQPAVFTDGAVAMRFMLEDKRDSLGLDFADLEFKEVHAGHLFVVRINPTQVVLQDSKTGGMRLDIREARVAKTPLTEEQKQAMEGKEKTFKHTSDVGKWHDLVVVVKGDQLSVSIDGEEVGSFKSPGFSHPTKRLLRLSVPRNAVVDDVKIWRKS